MNEALRVPAGGLLTTSELAAHPDFMLGLAVVSPSARTITGPGGTQDIEPRVMQVLVVLANSAGQVVTRETLFQRCWGGVYVGDDSLNRAVAGVRKVAAGIADNSFEIETIPRTGYRLSGAKMERVGPAADESGSRGWSRRELAGGALGVTALGAIGGWSIWSSRSASRFDALVESAEEALRKEMPDNSAARNQLLQAISLRPDSARAWGMLAYVASIGTVSADPKIAEPALKEAQEAAAKALALDRTEPYALLAMFELEGSTIDWSTRDQRLRHIMSIDPQNVLAIAELVLLTQAAGLNRESWIWNERALKLDPFSVDYLSKRALKLWIAGRVSQADKVIDQVQALYPTHPWPRFARFLILAFTDRARAAQAMLESKPDMLGSPDETALWRTALTALEQPSAGRIARLRDASFKAAATFGGFAGTTMMILSAVGDIDAAFDVANGFLLSHGLPVPGDDARGSAIAKDKARSGDDLNDATWRINTQFLFTPPCKMMRADARFLPLCDGIGLTEYWAKRRITPDYRLGVI